MDLSQFTTQESQEYSLPEMPSLKRKASSSSRTLVKKSKRAARSYFYPGRSLGLPARNSCIIPLTNNFTFDLSADLNVYFTFDTTTIYIDRTSPSSHAINGASHVGTVFDLMRIHHVEFNVIPAADTLSYNDQTLTTGQTNIPVLYEAFDPVGQAYRPLNEVQQLGTCKTGLFNKPYKKTIYPRLEGANGIVDVGVNQSNLFEHSGSSSSQRWRGWQLYLDMSTVTWTYGRAQVITKVYFECMMSK